MHLSTFLLPAFCTALASAAATPRPFSCGTHEPSPEHVKISQKFAQQEAEFAASGNFSILATINVDVYFHVVASSTSLSGGYVTVSYRTFPYSLFVWTQLTCIHRTRCFPTSWPC